MSIPTPACTPAARPDPVPRAASPAGAGLWIAPAVWKTRTIRSRLNAPASRRVSPTALGRHRTPPTRSTGKIVVLFEHDVTGRTRAPVANPMGGN